MGGPSRTALEGQFPDTVLIGVRAAELCNGTAAMPRARLSCHVQDVWEHWPAVDRSAPMDIAVLTERSGFNTEELFYVLTS